DPHKASHTVVAISAAEEPLGEVRVRASAAQAQRLLAWAAAWPERTWAIEGAGGLGHLLAQQLGAAGGGGLGGAPQVRGPGAAPGCGCSRRETRTRTTRMTPARWRSQRCAHRPAATCWPKITQRC